MPADSSKVPAAISDLHVPDAKPAQRRLANQIMSHLHVRAARATSNFADVLPAGDSELMQQLTKDPYNLEFLTLTAFVAERDLERALVAQVERFPLGLGTGFAFVGRQWRLKLDGDEFFIDLLMFHGRLRGVRVVA